MKRILLNLLIALAASSATFSAVRADVVIYNLPGTNMGLILQGRTKVNPGRTVSFRHPKLGSLVFGLNEVEIIKQPPLSEITRRECAKASRSKDVDTIFAATRTALHRGFLDQFYEGLDDIQKIDPQNEDVQNVLKLKKLMAKPLGSYDHQVDRMKKLVRNNGMEIAVSDHFLLLHDTPDKPIGKSKKTRAEERLELLEKVYEAFLLKFYFQGMKLEVPNERLMVVLFQEYQDFLEFSTEISPSLSSAAGFYDPSRNMAFFYDHGSDELQKALRALSESLQETKKKALRIRAANTADIVRMANTISLLTEISRENADIKVVSHEATHQMAANTGLLPRHVRVPSWVHEGLATYFESPNDASWTGMGAVNSERLQWYRMIANMRDFSTVDFIVGDQIFDLAGNNFTTVAAYGQAWALTHFLMERHFDEFMEFYRRLGEMPPYIVFSPDILNDVFDASFKSSRRSLDLQWRSYMRSLKTDLDKIVGKR